MLKQGVFQVFPNPNPPQTTDIDRALFSTHLQYVSGAEAARKSLLISLKNGRAPS